MPSLEHDHATAGMAIASDLKRDDGLRVRQGGAVEVVPVEDLPRVGAGRGETCCGTPAGAVDDVNITNTDVPAALAATLRKASAPMGATPAWRGGDRQDLLGGRAVPAVERTGLLEQKQVRAGGDGRCRVAAGAKRADEVGSKGNG